MAETARVDWDGSLPRETSRNTGVTRSESVVVMIARLHSHRGRAVVCATFSGHANTNQSSTLRSLRSRGVGDRITVARRRRGGCLGTRRLLVQLIRPNLTGFALSSASGLAPWF